jgi:hypothetical protein
MHAKRPLTWILVVVMALTVWGLSTGNVRIDSGDASVGGTKGLDHRPSSRSRTRCP